MIIRALPFLSLALGAVIAGFVDVSSATAAADVTSCQQQRTFHDLDGDGYVDAVVGDPYATVDGAIEPAGSRCCSAAPTGGSGRASAAC